MNQETKGLILPHHSKISFVSRTVDALAIFAVLYVSGWLHGVPRWEQYEMVAFVAMLLFYVFAESLQIYRLWRGEALHQVVVPVLTAWGLTLFAIMLLGYMTKTTANYSRVVMGIWLVGVPSIIILSRLVLLKVLRYFRARGFNTRRVAVAGANSRGEHLAQIIRNTPSLGMHLVGFYDDRVNTHERITASAQVLGNFEDLVQKAKEDKLDLIYITLPLKGEARIKQMLTELSDTCVSVHIVPDLFTFDVMSSRLYNMGSLHTVSVFESPFYGVEGWAKRMEDILLSLLILGVVFVPMLIIALGVKLSSPGPVLFKQRRCGLSGRSFKVFKFRTMTVCEDGKKIVQVRKNDARVTPFGAFLRKTSLDELPQFFNVLMGDMSVVGPRPHAVAHNEEYRKLIFGYMLRHKVKPGITGWAQVNGWRGETDTLEKMEKRVEYDLWYIRSWSIWLDLKIVFRTLLKGIVGQNAY